MFRTWAEIFELPDFTLMAVLGGSIVNANRPEDWRRFFELLQRPDWRDRQPLFEDRYGPLRADDLYPDAVGSIAALRSAGYRVAVTANQPARRRDELEALGIDVEVMAMSEAMGPAARGPRRRRPPGGALARRAGRAHRRGLGRRVIRGDESRVARAADAFADRAGKVLRAIRATDDSAITDHGHLTDDGQLPSADDGHDPLND